jgi:hypothetical protein
MSTTRAAIAIAALALVRARTGAAGGFVAGASVVDITPPLAATATSNPANCDTTGTYDGPHLFSLEEPYQDLNHNGRYDGDPSTGGPEPFLDCPTPTANGDVRPPDGRWDGIYLGGGDGHDRLPTAVLDPVTARTIVVGNGARKISITVADNEGVFREIWELVRQKVRHDGGFGLDEMFMSSTHDESAPDTIGITGPNETTSGVDPFYVEFMVAQVARGIEQAAQNTQPATIRFGQIHPDDLVPCWSSYPFVADESVGVMQARALSGAVIATLYNYGIHAEELGFSQDDQDRLHLASDWHHFARAALETQYGGVAVAMAGAVGSVEMPKVFDGARSFVPSGEHSVPGNGGCRTIYDTSGMFAPYGYTLSNEARGERVAFWAGQALAAGADSRSTVIDFGRTSLFLPLDNILFQLGGTIGIFPYKDAYMNGVLVPKGPNGGASGNEFRTDVAWYTIGDGQFVTTPGEVFPFTYVHDFSGPDDLALPEFGPVHGWVMAALSGRWRFIEGLGEDMVGYIFPRSNAVDVPTPAHFANDPGDVDRFGCGHSDDGEAAAEAAGDLLNDAVLSLLPPSHKRADRVRVGRYVWPDGSLHRNPIGEGRLGCDSASSGFVAAPDGGAIAVWALSPGSATFNRGAGKVYRLQDTPTFGPAHRNAQWMDVRGQPQSAPGMQTRGVILGGRERVWLDVFPETTGLTALPPRS